MKDELNWEDDKVNKFDDDALIEDDGYDADFDDADIEAVIKAGCDDENYDADDLETAAYAEDYNLALQSMWELRNGLEELDCIFGCEEITYLEDTVGYNIIIDSDSEYTLMLTLRMHNTKCYVYSIDFDYTSDEINTSGKPVHTFSLIDKFEVSEFIDFVAEYCKVRNEWVNYKHKGAEK